MSPTTEPVHGVVGELESMLVPLDVLHEDPRNARTHDERSIDALTISLTRFGQRAPLIVQRQGMIVRGGNGRLLAMRTMGWTHCAALIVDEADAEAVAFAIADNRTADLSSWDYGKLDEQLQSLDESVLPVLGFTPEELDSISLSASWSGTVMPEQAAASKPDADFKAVTLKVQKESLVEVRVALAELAARFSGKVILP